MKWIAMVLALIAVVGCKRKRPEEATEPPPGSAAGGTQTRTEVIAAPPAAGSDVTKRFEACWGYWNDASWDRFTSCYAPDAVSEEPGSGRPPATDVDAIVAEARRVKTAFPDMKGEPQLELVSGRDLVSIVLVHGTQTGPLDTPTGVLAPTNRKVGVFLSQIIELTDDGRARRVARYDDAATLMGQLVPSRDRQVRPPIEALPQPKDVAIAGNDDKERTNLSVVQHLLDVLNKHDLVGLDGVVSDDVVWSEAAAPIDHDKAGLRSAMDQLWKGIPDLTFTTSRMYAAGDYVAIAGAFEGTIQHDVPSLHLRKTGKHAVVPFDAIHKIEGGKITESWVFFQSTALGMAPVSAAMR